MKKLIRVPAVLMLLFAGGCTQFPSAPVATVQMYDPVDSFQQYVQRSDKVTLTAGNAPAVNTRIQEIDPWPRHVGNARIVANGELMADAVYRYRCQKGAPPTLQPLTTSTVASSSTGGAATASGGTTRPGDDCGGGQVSGSAR
jgi:hypothetical protein